jgi:hypothetical protein
VTHQPSPTFLSFIVAMLSTDCGEGLPRETRIAPQSAAGVKCSSVFERWKSRPIHCIRMSTGAKILRRGVQCGKLCLFVPRCVHHGRSVPAVIPSPLAVNLPVASRLVQYPEFGATFESFLAPQNNSMQRAVLLQYLLNS